MAIPKLIHRIWFGPREMPDLYVQFGQEWLTLNPGWEIRHWGYDNLPQLINQTEFDQCGKTWHPGRGDAKEATMIQVTQADIAAYEILHKFGGLYLNCDMKPIKPLPANFREHDMILSYEIDGWLISNAFMAATPEHPLLKSVIKAIPASVSNSAGRSMDWVTGPKLLTAVKKETHDTVTVWPAKHCNPFMPNENPQIFDETIAAHFWGHAMPDEQLWPNLQRQPGEQRYN
jgi:mannosyltransferase OCH1-like enzyme